MNYILKVITRYKDNNGNTARSWAFMHYEEACKKMVENLESLNRQLMVTDLTDVTGYTIMLTEWLGGNKYEKVAWINYDMAL
jgi:hypothetical protein